MVSEYPYIRPHDLASSMATILNTKLPQWLRPRLIIRRYLLLAQGVSTNNYRHCLQPLFQRDILRRERDPGHFRTLRLHKCNVCINLLCVENHDSIPDQLAGLSDRSCV